MNKYRDEIKLVYPIVTHPAGYNMGFAGIFGIRSTDQGTYEVNWEDKNDKVHYRAFIDPMKACAYYVRERHRRKLGIDYEIAAWKMDKALT